MSAYQTSVVGLVDILGVSERLSKPETARRYSEAVAAILSPMIADKGEFCLVLPHAIEPRMVEVFLSASSGTHLSFISDSIVVSAPIDIPGERDGKCSAILACLETVKALQRSLLMLGLRSRGGISIGGLIHSGELLVGDGLVRAYDLERTKSVVPRAVIDPALIDHLVATRGEHLAVYSNRIAHALRKDEDGWFFVDYLAYSPMDGYGHLELEFPAILGALAEDLKTSEGQRWVPKLEWLLRYASAANQDCRSGKVEPFDHADSSFVAVFPRTTETIVDFLESETAIIEILRSTIPAERWPVQRTHFLWPLGWATISTIEKTDHLNAELRRELSPGHVLYGQNFQVLGRLRRSDDFLFQIKDGRVAQVHLTWTEESYPDWPVTKIYPSFFTWSEAWRSRHRH